MNIGFIGLGKLGMPCAEEVAKAGHFVFGYDVESRNSCLVDIRPSIKEVVIRSDIIFIAVPTPHDKDYDGSKPCMHLEPKDFDYSIVENVIKEINKYVDNQLIVLISTVLPGTTRERFTPMKGRFVYNPYLIAMGTVAFDFTNPEIVMIGTEDGTETGDAKELIRFYKTIARNDPPYIVGTWDECECIKVFYNTFISNKISFVNMIQDVAERQGNINVDVVTGALCQAGTRIINSSYMTAGMGDGGACHPRDNIALRFLAKKLRLGYDLFEGIMLSREEQARNLALKLVELAIENSMPIVIHGKAYKPRVSYIEGSYGLLVGHFCKEVAAPYTEDIAISYVDKCTGDTYDSKKPAVFLLAHSATTTYRYWDNPDSDELYCEIPEGSIVVDPWRKFTSDTLEVIHYGKTR